MNWRKTFYWVSIIAAGLEFLYSLNNNSSIAWLFIIIFVILAYVLHKMETQDNAFNVLIQALGGTDKIVSDFKSQQKESLKKQLAEIEAGEIHKR